MPAEECTIVEFLIGEKAYHILSAKLEPAVKIGQLWVMTRRSSASLEVNLNPGALNITLKWYLAYSLSNSLNYTTLRPHTDGYKSVLSFHTLS